MVAVNFNLNITASLTGLHLLPKQILRMQNLCQIVTENRKVWQYADQYFNILMDEAFNISKISGFKNKTSLACGQYVFKAICQVCKYHTKLIYSALPTTTLLFPDRFLPNTGCTQIYLLTHMWCKSWNVHERQKMIVCFPKWLCIHKNMPWVHAVLRYVSCPDSDAADKIIHVLLKKNWQYSN